ncbi:MAG: M20 family metallopeptidase [Chloroflexota bacterium]
MIGRDKEGPGTMPLNRDDWKRDICRAVDALGPRLVEHSHGIHADPEIAFNEHHASARLADELEEQGFQVSRGIGGLPTAFRADLQGQEPGPTIAILAEYDALPEIGHACGHNVIATSALGAGLALARTAGADFAGRISVIGTPAEEGGGGKIILAEAGVFSDVDVAIMMHPSTRNIVMRGSLAHSRIEIVFHGKAAHAAGSPDKGINALEAVIQTFVGVNGHRLHMRGDARVHGIITHGGDAVNIIPARAAAKFSVRARSRSYQRELVEMVRSAAEGAGRMTGARLEWTELRGYDNMVPNPTVGALCAANMESLGLEVVVPSPNERMGSTDMGDISQILPAIHAYFAVASDGIPGHSVEFAAAAISEMADGAVLYAAKSLAMTAADLLADHDLVKDARQEFSEMLAQGKVAGFAAWQESGRGMVTDQTHRPTSA